MVKLEIAVTTLEDAVRAAAGGANSVELSYDLARDGLTPSTDLVKAVKDAIDIDLHVMVRPHDRDFVYVGDEIDLILEQAQTFSEMGVTGIVFGAQKAHGELDVDLIKRVAEVVKNAHVTMHRAIDSCVNPDVGLAKLKGVVHRVLTSGPARTAWAGREGLKEWVSQHSEAFSFVAAGSITLETIREIAIYTGVQECHSSRAARTNGLVDVDKVRQLLHQLDDI